MPPCYLAILHLPWVRRAFTAWPARRHFVAQTSRVVPGSPICEFPNYLAYFFQSYLAPDLPRLLSPSVVLARPDGVGAPQHAI